MPAQILVTHMNKAEVQKRIADAKLAEDALAITDGPDANNFLVVCNDPAAHGTMQAIADEDSRRTRDHVAKMEAEAEKATTKASSDES